MSIEHIFEATANTHESAMESLANQVREANNLLQEKHVNILPISPGQDNQTCVIECRVESGEYTFVGEAIGNTYHGTYKALENLAVDSNIKVSKVKISYMYELTRKQERVLNE